MIPDWSKAGISNPYPLEDPIRRKVEMIFLEHFGFVRFLEHRHKKIIYDAIVFSIKIFLSFSLTPMSLLYRFTYFYCRSVKEAQWLFGFAILGNVKKVSN